MHSQSYKLVMVYSPKVVRANERVAATRGLERFKPFRVGVEEIDVDRQKVGLVKCGEALKRMATSNRDMVITYADLGCLSAANVWHFILNRELTTGIALTTFNLLPARDEGELVNESGRSIGLGMVGMGAVVNVRAFEAIEDATVRDSAIRLATIHELGHVFGINGHCKQPTCVMQENKDKKDFVERFVIPGLDFCRECVSVINKEVSRALIRNG